MPPLWARKKDRRERSFLVPRWALSPPAASRLPPRGRLGEDPQTPSRHRFPVAPTVSVFRPHACLYRSNRRTCTSVFRPFCPYYGHLSRKQEKNLTRSTWQVTKTARFVPSGMLQHGGGNVFRGFCYLREARVLWLGKKPGPL